ncbi:DNA polymerase III subunit tau [Clostridium tepidiprofundi DSM 19306]|uniref:DNA polymerase III subunit delta' n=1 Tax=Clostridium tepidiprofundi DSM 19306 TaxID=1121338 RepID=A0A151AWB2_9CLOT|nr:DNA polymerase III subunit delta' [Clostridium tepidiprofundi]KYH31901.1 DNA polymerase III subunit tau [Clostridium tepidiprofundi DSM 19306]
MDFSGIIGHKNIIKELINAIEEGRFAHAHILVGEDGIGKSLIARYIALKILGKNRDTQCVDIIEWKMAKNKRSLGVDDIRKLIEEINKKPYEGENKVIIVYEAHNMTVQAQNAFLKTIEEAPEGTYIILLCENLDKILDTIKSRCQIHKLRVLSDSEIMDFIDKKYTHLMDEEKKILIAFSNGVPGRIERFLKDDKFNEIRKETLQILANSSRINKGKMIKYEKFFIENREYWEEILNSMISYVRDLMIYKELGIEKFIINIDKTNEIKELSNMFSFNKLSKLVDIVDETRKRLDKNLNPSLVFDMMLLKIQEV